VSTGRDRIVAADLVGTAALAVLALAATLAPDTLAVPYAVLAGAEFLAGCAAFLWAYAIAVGRSRTEVISVPGVWFLSGSTPTPVRRRLLGALAAQVVIVVAAASVRPYTAVAFGVLAPIYGLGLAGLWAARNGTFPPRPADEGRRARA
jgi:hypothetical protein